jgi:hypothetical protein
MYNIFTGELLAIDEFNKKILELWEKFSGFAGVLNVE